MDAYFNEFKTLIARIKLLIGDKNPSETEAKVKIVNVDDLIGSE